MEKTLLCNISGRDIFKYVLRNRNGMQVTCINYGATITSIRVPDRCGEFSDIILSYDTLEEYMQQPYYFGATVGRYANRIAGGRFSIDGIEYRLTCNEGENHLHGGHTGFDRVIWEEADLAEHSESICFKYFSREGEEGYPGNLDAFVRFTLTDENTLQIHYTALSDKPTVVNLSNHAYFNLCGHDKGDISSHWLKINAGYYAPVDMMCIPTGEVSPAQNTPFDFMSFHRIGERIEAKYSQLEIANGYDHNYFINGRGWRVAAQVFEERSGRLMSVYTDKPCMQLYSGNCLKRHTGRGGALYRKRAGFCLETQFAPDSPNQSLFESQVLIPGKIYDYQTYFKFNTVEGLDLITER